MARVVFADRRPDQYIFSLRLNLGLALIRRSDAASGEPSDAANGIHRSAPVISNPYGIRPVLDSRQSILQGHYALHHHRLPARLLHRFDLCQPPLLMHYSVYAFDLAVYLRSH